MSAKGLGRGFDSLFPSDWVDDDAVLGGETDVKMGSLEEIALSKIHRDEEQPRKEFDEQALQELADSIKEYGVLQPIVLTKDGAEYKIVAGERRWRAAKIAGLKDIPAIVRTMDDQRRLLVSVIENAQREDLNAIELAAAYVRLSTQFNLSVKEMAEKVGKSEATVTNTLRLLNLPEAARKAMLEHSLTEGVMRPLVNLDEDVVMKILPRIIEEGWTARKVEQYVKTLKPISSSAAIKQNTYFKEEEKLSEQYRVKTKIKARSVTFMCKNEKELKELLKRLGK